MDINLFKPTGVIRKKHLISLQTYSEEEIYEILHAAAAIEKMLAAGEKLNVLKNKYVSLLTKRSFARSRIAFETAVTKLGGIPMISTMHGSELENILKDKLTVKAIAGYGMSAIVVQTAEMGDAEQIEKNVDLPIINGNSRSGPCEALAALYTVWKRLGKLGGLKVSAIGKPENYADSFLYGFAGCGLDITVICKKEDYPTEKLVNYCRQYVDISVTDDVEEGIKNADVIFVSDDHTGIKLLESHLGKAKPQAIVLHALPVAEDGNLDLSVTEKPCFLGLEEAHCLPLIEMAAMSLLISK